MKKRSPPWFYPFLQRFKSSSNELAFFESLVKHDDIVRLPVYKPNYIVNDPEAIYHILLTNRDNYTKAGTSYERIENVVGKGLLTASGQDWSTRRHQYQPYFQDKNVKKYTATILKYTESMLSVWKFKSGSSINISEQMLALGMNIASEAFLGLDISERSLDLVRMIHTLNDYAVRSIILWRWLPTLKNFRYQVAKKTTDNFILSSLKQQPVISEPLLKDLLLKNEEGQLLLPEDDVLGEVKNFFLAGYETTGNALCWTLYCLAKNPYALTHLLDEIKQILGTTLPDCDSIEHLPYLDMIIKESLRLYPPIWNFTRKAIAADTLLQYTIPSGAIINILPFLIHRHPKYWNQPHIFYPERFLEQASQSRPKCAYIPFGFGPRACIGRQFAILNMKMILILILQRFDIKLPHQHYRIDPLPIITLKTQKPLKLNIKKRNGTDTPALED